MGSAKILQFPDLKKEHTIREPKEPEFGDGDGGGGTYSLINCVVSEAENGFSLDVVEDGVIVSRLVFGEILELLFHMSLIYDRGGE